MLARKALAGTAGAPKEYVEDVFNTWVYTGSSSAQSFTNNIDLSTEGGLVWTKKRVDNSTSGDLNHILFDTARQVSGNDYLLSTNTTSAQSGGSNYINFNTDGFGWTGSDTRWNYSGDTYVSWTFRKAKKFFDVVTFTTSSSTNTNQRISHNLGSTPGTIIVKNTGGTSAWPVWHRSLSSATDSYLTLNTTDAASTYTNCWGTSGPTSTDFGINTNFFGTSANYVAYVFAHDAGGFGDAGSDNVITCGSYTGNSSSDGPTITLGYEPQWLLIKNASAAASWRLFDNMRGLTVSGQNDYFLASNNANAEDAGNLIEPLATGFKLNVSSSQLNTTGQTYIYIAIRKGPMKTPETGTSVFAATAFSGNDTSGTRSAGLSGFDLLIAKRTASSSLEWVWLDKLRGLSGSTWLSSVLSTGEGTGDIINTINGQYTQDGINITKTSNYSYLDSSGSSYVWYALKRAPKFFDEVCYSGTGSSRDLTHNLGVVPELIITKARNQNQTWYSMANIDGSGFQEVRLDANDAATSRTYASSAGFDAQPTATILNLDGSSNTNASGYNYVAYLFATLAGISKVGTYTGNGSSQTINCGFTNGARLILIKRIDSSGDWYTYDTARGIVSGNDSQLKLNTTAVAATGYDAVDPDNSGFIVNNDATNFPINVNSASYIFLAIA